MATNYNTLQKGLIRLAVLLLLFILTPILITISFKALKNYTESPEIFIAYFLLLLSFTLLVVTIIFAFKTFKLLLDAFFNQH